MIHLKRAYVAPAADDGMRILVERLWPRGLTRDKAAIDWWAKAIAPSAELRKWYAHDVEKWPEFSRRYRAELDGNPEAVAELKQRIGRKHVTFVFAAHDETHNSAVVLKAYLERQRK
jgi:uncharacterized protein YeaO (DUF488 family)